MSWMLRYAQHDIYSCFLVSRIANKLRMSESIDVRNPSGIMDLAGHTYSRNFCYTTLDGNHF